MSLLCTRRPPPWSAALASPIHLRNGTILRTRDDARHYMTALPKHRERRQAWQHAAKLLLEGAEAYEVTKQIEYALLIDGELGQARPARAGSGGHHR